METTHRPFRRRQLLQSYTLFTSLVSQQLGKGLEGVTPFVVMDIIHTVIRLLRHETRKTESQERQRSTRSGDGGLISLCLHVLTTLCKAALESCPEVCCVL